MLKHEAKMSSRLKQAEKRREELALACLISSSMML